MVKLSEKSLESCLHEGYVLFSCVDPLWIQKYVSKFSCGRNKKEQQRFNKEVPVGSLQNILDKLFFAMEACKKCYMTACHLHYTTCVHWVYICILPFVIVFRSMCAHFGSFVQTQACGKHYDTLMIAACLCLNMIVLARNFQLKLNQGQRNANLVTIYFAKKINGGAALRKISIYVLWKSTGGAMVHKRSLNMTMMAASSIFLWPGGKTRKGLCFDSWQRSVDLWFSRCTSHK